MRHRDSSQREHIGEESSSTSLTTEALALAVACDLPQHCHLPFTLTHFCLSFSVLSSSRLKSLHGRSTRDQPGPRSNPPSFPPLHSFIIDTATNPVLQAANSQPTCLLKTETLAPILLHTHCKTANNIKYVHWKMKVPSLFTPQKQLLSIFGEFLYMFELFLL